MKERTALEIADKLYGQYDLGYIGEAYNMLRRQHAEIERLKRERHHIYDLLARIHRDGGQYTAEHGIEKACDDAEAQVVTWLETLNSVDALIEQARIAEREACAEVCDRVSRSYGENRWYTSEAGSDACGEYIRARGKSWPKN